MAVTASQYVGLLVKQNGIGEDPPGSNHNKFTEWYWGKGTRGSAYAWCAVFTCWGFDQLGARSMIPWTASCSAAVRGWKERGQWLGATKSIRVGDIFYIPGGSTGFEHVGVVAKVNSNGTFVSIEGNWTNKVTQKTRTISKYQYARPAYGSAAPINPSLPTTSKYVPFPGAAFFRSAPRHDIITQMGKRLVAVGCSKYEEGPGPQWTDADKNSYAAWQRKLGYSGADADGYPGKESWDKLQVPNPKYAAPKPPPAPPKPPVPPVEVPPVPQAARLVRVKGQDAVYAVTYTGAVHVKNQNHLRFLQKQGWVTAGIADVAAGELADLLEKE